MLSLFEAYKCDVHPVLSLDLLTPFAHPAPPAAGRCKSRDHRLRSNKFGSPVVSAFAERTGFEPVSRFRRLHAFQACLFSHSSIFPLLQRYSMKGTNKRKTAKIGKSLALMGFKTNRHEDSYYLYPSP